MQGRVNGILKGIGYVQDKYNETLCRNNCYDNTEGADASHKCVGYSEVNSFKHV